MTSGKKEVLEAGGAGGGGKAVSSQGYATQYSTNNGKKGIFRLFKGGGKKKIG